MAIKINLEDKMKEKGVTLAQLAEEVGITPVNLSNIKTGKISSFRLPTLDKICEALDCQPGDILEYERRDKRKVIPLFLDYSGTTDLILRGGAGEAKKFFDAITGMQQKLGYEIRAIMVTGSSRESAKAKYKLLSDLAENSGLPHLFDGAVAEYCGYIIRDDKTKVLNHLDFRILEKRKEIEEIVRQYGGEINSDVESMYNVLFENITRTQLAETSEAIDRLLGDSELETVTYYDDYGKECDIKPKQHSKATAVRMLVEDFNEKFDIPFVIVGGDSQEEDLKMYTENRDIFRKMGLESVFIAPSNFGKYATYDKNIILSDWENSNGIADAIDKLTERTNVRDDGGLEI